MPSYDQHPTVRLRTELDLTQSELSRRLDLSSQAINSLECGFPSVFPEATWKKIRDALTKGNLSPVGDMRLWRSYPMINGQYLNFKTTIRAESGLRLSRIPTALYPGPHEHPHQAFRRLAVGTNTRSFCKLLAVNPELVVAYEGGVKTGEISRRSHYPINMPRLLSEAYAEAGVDWESLRNSVTIWIGTKQ